MDRIVAKAEWNQGLLQQPFGIHRIQGLEPLPPCVFDLDVLLNAPVVDLKKVAMALHSDVGF